MKRQVVNLGVTLLVVGLVAAIGLGLTYTITKKRIEEEDRLAEAKASASALPDVKSPSELKAAKALLEQAKKASPDVQKVYTSPAGTILIIKSKGYGGPLSLAVGIDNDGKVAGVAVISDRETVGLGSRALEPAYLGDFKGKSGRDQLTVGKDIQGITGATISSKAVAGEVKTALEAYANLSR